MAHKQDMKIKNYSDEICIWSEFQPLEKIAIGNIPNKKTILNNTISLSKEHNNHLSYILEETENDLKKIKNFLEKLSIEVIQCEQYNPFQYPQQNFPLAIRDWFIIYGDEVNIPHTYKSYNQKRSRSLDHFFDKYNKVFREFGEIGDNFNTEDLKLNYIDTANFLRCGIDIFYTTDIQNHGCFQGIDYLKKWFKKVNQNIRFHPIHNVGPHLDGSLFFVKPGLIITTIENELLPNCLKSWDKIFLDDMKKTKFQEKTKSLKDKKFHPLYLKEWIWYKEANSNETAFTLNNLSLDQNTVICSGYNEYVFKELEKRKIDCINLNLQTCDFWDNGLHCMTNEIKRKGDLENYF